MFQFNHLNTNFSDNLEFLSGHIISSYIWCIWFLFTFIFIIIFVWPCVVSFPSQLLELQLLLSSMRMIEGYFVMLLFESGGKKWVNQWIQSEEWTGYKTQVALNFSPLFIEILAYVQWKKETCFSPRSSYNVKLCVECARGSKSMVAFNKNYLNNDNEIARDLRLRWIIWFT
jgi:hypothetical protein